MYSKRNHFGGNSEISMRLKTRLTRKGKKLIDYFNPIEEETYLLVRSKIS